MTAPKPFTFDEIVDGLRFKGVGELAAKRAAMRTLGMPQRDEPAPAARSELTFPVRLTLPWSALCSDNEHEKASLIRLANGEIVPRKVMGARYKLARDKTRTIAKQTLGNPAPSTSPLSIVARVWVPDERPHDVCNFAKCCHDALEGIVYKNDFRLYDTRWVRAGVDVDSPRAEITISPLSGSTVQET